MIPWLMTFMASKAGKWIVGGALVLATALAVHGVYSLWRSSIYDSGYSAAKDKYTAQIERIRADSAQAIAEAQRKQASKNEQIANADLQAVKVTAKRREEVLRERHENPAPAGGLCADGGVYFNSRVQIYNANASAAEDQARTGRPARILPTDASRATERPQ